MSRHPFLHSGWSRSIEHDRLRFNKHEAILAWFDFWKEVKERYDFDICDIYNMDEKGFAQGICGTLKVMCDRRLRANEHALIAHCGRREWTSVIECVSADGEPLPPHLIFAGHDHSDDWLDMLIECGCAGGSTSATEKGWTNNEIGLAWLQDSFEPHSRRRQRGEYRCLILDGHGSHVTNEAIQFCIDQKITLVCLPSHSTHLLQPLDVGLFSPLSIYYKGGLEAFLHGRHGFTVDKLRFIEIFASAHLKTMSKSNIQSAWTKAGLFPHCPDVVLTKVPKDTRPETPVEGSVTITDFKGLSVTMYMSPEKATIVNECVERLNDSTDREAAMKLAVQASQAIADCHMYKRTNENLLEVARLEEERKSRRKGVNSKAKVLNEWIRSAEHMATLMEEELKALHSIHLDVFRYSTVAQKSIDQAKLQAVKEATKEAAKVLTISKRQAAKDLNDTCKAFRNLATMGIFELESFQTSPRKSPIKTNVDVLNGPHLPPPQTSPIRASSPVASPLSSSVLSPPPSPTRPQAGRRQPPRVRKKTMKALLSEEEEIPIQPRLSRVVVLQIRASRR